MSRRVAPARAVPAPAVSLRTPSRVVPCLRGGPVRRLGAAAGGGGRFTHVAEAARRSPGRSAWQDGGAARRGGASRGAPRQPAREREPFDAELVTLFGVPVLVLGLAYAANEPKSLAIVCTLGLLLPGVRDVLLHVLSDLWTGARRTGAYFSDSDVPSGSASEGGYAAQQAAAQTPRRPRRGAPPPPPPPPFEYEMRPGDYAVYPPAQPFEPPLQPPQPPRSPFADGWPAGPAGGGAVWQPPAAGGRQGGAPPHRRPYSQRPPAAANPAQQASTSSLGRGRRSARPSRPAGTARAGRQGGAGADATPLLLRPLFALVPPLRYWGGFL